MRRSLVSLIALAALTFLLGLGRQAITDADEAYYAEAAREMVQSGDWLTPHYNYSDRWQKPVLYYWLTAAAYTVTGVGEFAARLWAALAGIALVALTWAVAKWHTRDPDAPWLAGAIVATAYGYFAMARMALPDLPLAACITATIAAALEAGRTGARRWWALFGVAAGLGFLMKGPVALAVPAVALAPIWWLERREARVHVAGLATAAVAAALVGLPWYAAMTATHGRAYLESFFIADNLERFATDRFNAPRPLWFYPAVLAGGLMPWTLFAIVPCAAGLRAATARRHTWSRAELRLWAWALLPLGLFMVSIGQQPRYILPILPPLAILIADGMAWRTRAGGRGLRGATLVAAAMLCALAVALLRLRPVLVTAVAGGPVLGALLLVSGAALLLLVVVRGRWQALPEAVAGAAAVLLLTIQFGALAGARPEAVERMADAVRRARVAGERVGPYHAFVRNLVFYTGIQQEDLFDTETAVRFLRSPDRVLLVVPEEELAALEQAAGVRTRELFRVPYLDTARLRVDALVRPAPDERLRDVLLVSNR